MQITFNRVTADYQLGPLRTPRVLDEVDIAIPSGSITAIVGHSGAGKSSLLKAMNGLLIPKSGEVCVGNFVIDATNHKQTLKKVRKKVGMVFQFPESQLFAETVEKDICFGPMNFGVSEQEAKEIARKVITQVGLPVDLLKKSPFALSGGQKRRVAIAGILAMQPEVLVLDEPGAGLDPIGKYEILSLIKSWHTEQGLTTLFVTHDMNDVALFADDVIVMDKGKVVAHDDVRTVFGNTTLINEWKLDVPDARRFQLSVENKSGMKLPGVCLTMEELADGLIEVGMV